MTLEQLQDSAERSCIWRGHYMGAWRTDAPGRSSCTCMSCGRGVWCNTKPAPNEIDIHGEAVAVNCGDPKGENR